MYLSKRRVNKSLEKSLCHYQFFGGQVRIYDTCTRRKKMRGLSEVVFELYHTIYCESFMEE